jgi:hypothetical protein
LAQDDERGELKTPHLEPTQLSANIGSTPDL